MIAVAAGMACRRIVFTGDFLRPSWRGDVPTQHYNIQWCRNLLGRQIAQATGLGVEMVAWSHDGVTDGQLDACAVNSFYATLGLPRSIESWGLIYEEPFLSAQIDAFVAELFRDALVVAFELPPYLEHALRRHGIPYVDLITHPVRFLDDIFFAIRTSSEEANRILARYAIPEDYIRTMAGIQSAAASRHFHFAPPPNSALLLLQTRFDRTQIRDGKFIGAIDFLPEIAKVAASCETLYLKTHPLEPQTSHAIAVQSAFRNVELTTHNVYSLMAVDHIGQVATLSSSTGIEAEYFGKRARYIYRPPNLFALDGAVPKGEEFVGVFDAFLNADFWREVLAPLVPTTAPTGWKVPFKPNRLRTSLQAFWNFNEIDTDFAVNLVLAAKRKEEPAEPASGPAGRPVLPYDLRGGWRLAPHSVRRNDGLIEIGKGPAGHGVFGPYLPLRPGAYRVVLELAGDSKAPGINLLRKGSINIDVAINARDILTHRRIHVWRLGRRPLRQQLRFTIPPAGGLAEIRIWTNGKTPILVREALLTDG